MHYQERTLRGMAKLKVRYLVPRRRQGGHATVYYWQPTPALIEAGWTTRPLKHPSGAWMELGDAILAAEAVNAKLDAWRGGGRLDGVEAWRLPDTIGRAIAAFWAWKYLARRSAALLAQYRGVLKKVDALIGDRPIASLTREWAKQFIEGHKTPATQRAALAAVSRFVSFLVDQGYLTAHLFTKRQGNGIELAQSKSSQRIRIWSQAEFDYVMRAADQLVTTDLGVPYRYVSIGDAVMLGLYWGQRQGDMRALSWPARRETELTVRQSKKGRVVTLPLTDTHHAALEARLDAMRMRAHARLKDRDGADRLDLDGEPMVAPEGEGARYSARWFGTRFGRVRHYAAALHAQDVAQLDEAGRAARLAAGWQAQVDFENLWYADLRDTCVTHLYESGADLGDICSITGHSETQAGIIIKHYLRLTGTRARRAMQRRAKWESEQ